MFDVVQKLRKQNFSTQKNFYLQAGLSKNYYSSIETKTCNYTLESFLRMCIHLRINPWRLMDLALSDMWDEVCERELNN